MDVDGERARRDSADRVGAPVCGRLCEPRNGLAVTNPTAGRGLKPVLWWMMSRM